VAQLVDLLPLLEEAAGRVDQRQVKPVDTHVAAFISARLERRLDSELAASDGKSAEAHYLAQLRLLAQLQLRLHPGPLPALAAWLAAGAGPAVAAWRNRERRTAVGQRLAALVAAGQLAPMLAVVEDPTGRGVDAREAQAAVAALERIDAELDGIAGGAAGRAAAAFRLGQEVAAGLGLITLATVLAMAALG
jgi:hypothetical protein